MTRPTAAERRSAPRLTHKEICTMEIRLSKANIFFDAHIQRVAEQAGCYARIKWATAGQCRFILVDKPLSYKAATFEQHDQVIHVLLQLDPLAKIRTAAAVYNGLADWNAQHHLALAGEAES